jgi:hypothetical protein
MIGGGHLGMQPSHVTEPLIAGITDNSEMAIGQLPQVADQVRAPVATSHYSDRDSFLQRFHKLLVSTKTVNNHVFNLL